ncbi:MULTISPECIES: MerR family transcriptional regulator [unclassified Terrabacter]|uniref:MerR family transcriptional regulator n=1 Tax=unclassified Terrabacter TaxID=2630222 RepID=UPI0009E95D59|nr:MULTISPECIES: MerR family transcriptional regulator [unclassified Terrabacter]
MRVPEPASDRGVYGISTAAELVGMGVQNLRLYEARGLLEPDRTEGGTRRYSADDLDRLRRISVLLGAGLNLAGIAMVLDLEAENTALRARKRRTTVADNRIDPGEEVPEADLLEQRAPLDPDAVADTLAAVPLDAPADLVDEADRLEQQAVVPDEGEDDYPHA